MAGPGTTYQVSYVVNVDAARAAQGVMAFTQALTGLSGAAGNIGTVTKELQALSKAMKPFEKRYVVKLNTRLARREIDKLNRSVTALKENLAAIGTVKAGGRGSKKTTTTTGKSATGSTSAKPATPVPVPAKPTTPTPPAVPKPAAPIPATPKPATPKTPTSGVKAGKVNYAPAVTPMPKNLSYKLLGPTPLPGNGGMAIDMLKGMGIAYGIAGIGSLISNITSQAVEYDNIMKTVENILKSHDINGNFSTRFANMANTIRQVGMETKFKVTEVADAAKFLAMAGIDLEGINNAIRPIADIALVGDTDMGTTADLVTNIMTGYNILPSRMRMAADIMTNTFTMSNTTLTEIAEAYKYAGSLLSAGGVPFEEATAAIGVLGDAGIKGSQAGTTMRTILANIVKPTGKQLQAWNAIGIERFDSSGNMRNLIDIFKDLSNANLQVADYYKIFHKTAASGAVALASHVDKWQEVTAENEMSGGLSSRLAEEKKNTLQGLWAQLVSIFTDNGVTAFTGIQETLKGFLKDTIAWLQTDDAKNTINEIAKIMVEFIKMMKSATIYFWKLYNAFKPFIHMWMKFSLYIWPITAAFKAFSTVLLSLMVVKRIANAFALLRVSILSLGSGIGATNAVVGTAATGVAAAGAGAGTAAVANSGGATGGALAALGITGGRMATKYGSVGLPWLAPLTAKNIEKSARGLDLRQPVLVEGAGYTEKAAFKKEQALYKKNLKKFNRRVKIKQAGTSVGRMAGMGAVIGGAGMMANDEMGDAGHAAGGLLAGAGIASMFATGPLGWGIAGALALGAGVAYLIEMSNKAAEATQRLVDSTKEFYVKEGQVIGENTGTVTKYLTMVQEKNENILAVEQMRIAAIRERLGLESTDVTSDAQTSVEKFNQRMNDFKEGNDQALPKYLADDKNQALLKSVGLSINKGYDGYDVTINGVGTQSHMSANAVKGIISIASEVALGKSTASITEEFYKKGQKYLNSGEMEGLLSIPRIVKEQYGSNLSEMDWHRNFTFDQWMGIGADESTMGKDPLVQRLVYNYLSNLFGEGNFNMLDAFYKFRTARDYDSSDLLGAFNKLVSLADSTILGIQHFGATANWHKALGWNGQTFIPQGQNTSSKEQADSVALALDNLLTFIQRYGLDRSNQPKVQAAVQSARDMRDMAKGYSMLMEGELMPGWTPPNGMMFPGKDGYYYKWNASTQMAYRDRAIDAYNNAYQTLSAGFQGAQQGAEQAAIAGGNNLSNCVNSSFYSSFINGISLFGGATQEGENGEKTEGVNFAPFITPFIYNGFLTPYMNIGTMAGQWGMAYADNTNSWFDFGFSSNLNLLGSAGSSIPSTLYTSSLYWYNLAHSNSVNLGASMGYTTGFNTMAAYQNSYNQGIAAAGGGNTSPFSLTPGVFKNAFNLNKVAPNKNNNGINLATGMSNTPSIPASSTGIPLQDLTKKVSGKIPKPTGTPPPDLGGSTGGGSTGGKGGSKGRGKGKGGGGGTKASDYKSHQDNKAIPKQINITIQNLMNVDKIDLSNPDHAAVVERMKREVAYALYEAAADGTMMLNGLT